MNAIASPYGGEVAVFSTVFFMMSWAFVSRLQSRIVLARKPIALSVKDVVVGILCLVAAIAFLMLNAAAGTSAVPQLAALGLGLLLGWVGAAAVGWINAPRSI